MCSFIDILVCIFGSLFAPAELNWKGKLDRSLTYIINTLTGLHLKDSVAAHETTFGFALKKTELVHLNFFFFFFFLDFHTHTHTRTHTHTHTHTHTRTHTHVWHSVFSCMFPLSLHPWSHTSQQDTEHGTEHGSGSKPDSDSPDVARQSMLLDAISNTQLLNRSLSGTWTLKYASKPQQHP